MKNFKLTGTGNFLQIGIDGQKLRSFQGGMQIIRNDEAGLATLSVATPLSPSHAVTKEYVDNLATLVVMHDVSADNPTIPAGEMGIVSKDGIILQNSPNGNVGELVRFNGWSYDLVTLTDGMRISTAIAIAGDDLTMFESHVYVLDTTSGIAWIDNGPSNAVESYVNKSIQFIADSGSFSIANGNNWYGLPDTFPAGSKIKNIHVGIDTAFNNDFDELEFILAEVVPTGVQFFEGQVAGMTTDVRIESTNIGVQDNYNLVADSVSTINALIAAQYAGGEMVLISGDGLQVPTADITLGGSVDNPRTILLFSEDVNQFEEETYHRDEVLFCDSEHKIVVKSTQGAVVPTEGQMYILVDYLRN